MSRRLLTNTFQYFWPLGPPVGVAEGRRFGLDGGLLLLGFREIGDYADYNRHIGLHYV